MLGIKRQDNNMIVMVDDHLNGIKSSLFENLASKLRKRDVTMNILINSCLVLCIDFLEPLLVMQGIMG